MKKIIILITIIINFIVIVLGKSIENIEEIENTEVIEEIEENENNNKVQLNEDDFENSKEISYTYEDSKHNVTAYDLFNVPKTHVTPGTKCGDSSQFRNKDDQDRFDCSIYFFGNTISRLKYSNLNCKITGLMAGENDYKKRSENPLKLDHFDFYADIAGRLDCEYKGVTMKSVKLVSITFKWMDITKEKAKKYLEDIFYHNPILTKNNSFQSLDGKYKLKVKVGDCAKDVWSYTYFGLEDQLIYKGCAESVYVLGDKNGKCGHEGKYYYFCAPGYYCSKYGYCGKSSEYKKNCQSKYGEKC